MQLSLNSAGWKRFFSVPCALDDNYLKLADGPALKVLLYIISSEDSFDGKKIIEATGITEEAFEDAVSFWKSLGVLTDSEEQSSPAVTAVQIQSEPAKKVVHSRYAPKDIAEMIKLSPELKELFGEAELTLKRILKHSDHEILISLRDYYGFSEQSIVLILSYCAELGKTSARYYETVAKGLFESGITEFSAIEAEFERLRELHSFESEVCRAFGLDIKLSSKQQQYISSWRDMGFGVEMISLAYERCVDQTNKLSFPYINKILTSWQSSGIFSAEAAEKEQKPQKQDKDSHSFDLDEFDMFTLGSGEDKK